MPTAFTEVYETFFSQFNDPVFNSLDVRDDLCKRYLINSIPKFRKCHQDLNDRDDALETFNISLIEDEKQILGNLMLVEYMSSQIVSLENIKQALKSKDFEKTSQANHLEKLLELRKSRQKEVSKMIVDYTYQYFDLTKLS